MAIYSNYSGNSWYNRYQYGIQPESSTGSAGSTSSVGSLGYSGSTGSLGSTGSAGSAVLDNVKSKYDTDGDGKISIDEQKTFIGTELDSMYNKLGLRMNFDMNKFKENTFSKIKEDYIYGNDAFVRDIAEIRLMSFLSKSQDELIVALQEQHEKETKELVNEISSRIDIIFMLSIGATGDDYSKFKSDCKNLIDYLKDLDPEKYEKFNKMYQERFNK